MTDDAIADAKKKVEKSFKAVQKDITKIHTAFHDVKNAGPFDDLHGLLDELESTVKHARTGGMLGSGAKGHRRALADYVELTAPEAAE